LTVLQKHKIQSVLEQSLRQLEVEPWPQSTLDSHLDSEIRRLRDIPLKQLRLEDLRLLIGQSLGLPYLVPLALDHVEAHPLAGGDFYPGDLLKNIMDVEEAFWQERPEFRRRLVTALERALQRVRKARVPADLKDEFGQCLNRHRSKLNQAV
jgi:CDI immunity proteins